AVQDYNVTVRSFPTNLTAMIFKMDVKPNFTVDNEKTISVPPTVDFGKSPTPSVAPPPPAPAPAPKN
ncbi:MAG TPA: LemA family protein, partial [Casimicrobiaceae bacterium]|nr:LemA family protein [Casimicrobiaceae bacterium]